MAASDGFDGRLIADAVRLYEAASGRPIVDRAAVAVAHRQSDDFEKRIIARAGALSIGHAIADSLQSTRRVGRFCLFVAFVLAVAAGAVTAITALTTPPQLPVNFHWSLLSLLGLQTLTLVLWLFFMAVSRNADMVPSLGGLVTQFGRFAAGRLNRQASASAAVAAVAAVTTRGRIGRWTVGAATHGLWLGFSIGAVAMALLVLSIRHIDFAWQTTILSADTYLPITEALAALPQIVGFPTPNAADIKAAEWTGAGYAGDPASQKWAGFLIGCLTLYGLAPRLVLFILCYARRRAAVAAHRLDLTEAGFLQLRDQLMPPPAAPAAPAPSFDGAADPVAADYPIMKSDGACVVIGLEIDAEKAHWPPALTGFPYQDLGVADDRHDQQRILADVAAIEPALILLGVSLLTTPDRGIVAFMDALRTASAAPALLLLTGHADLAKRVQPDDVGLRIADWRRLGGNAGIPADWCLDFDGDDPERTGEARLLSLLQRTS